MAGPFRFSIPETGAFQTQLKRAATLQTRVASSAQKSLLGLRMDGEAAQATSGAMAELVSESKRLGQEMEQLVANLQRCENAVRDCDLNAARQYDALSAHFSSLCGQGGNYSSIKLAGAMGDVLGGGYTLPAFSSRFESLTFAEGRDMRKSPGDGSIAGGMGALAGGTTGGIHTAESTETAAGQTDGSDGRSAGTDGAAPSWRTGDAASADAAGGFGAADMGPILAGGVGLSGTASQETGEGRDEKKVAAAYAQLRQIASRNALGNADKAVLGTAGSLQLEGAGDVLPDVPTDWLDGAMGGAVPLFTLQLSRPGTNGEELGFLERISDEAFSTSALASLSAMLGTAALVSAAGLDKGQKKPESDQPLSPLEAEAALYAASAGEMRARAGELREILETPDIPDRIEEPPPKRIVSLSMDTFDSILAAPGTPSRGLQAAARTNEVVSIETDAVPAGLEGLRKPELRR